MAPDYSRRRLLLLSFLVEGGALVLALLIAWLFGIKLLPLTEDLTRDIMLGTVGASLPLALFVFLLSEKVENTPLIGPLRKTIINNISLIFSKTKLPDLILISVLAGFAEEILFRGIIQAKLGLVAASIIFGLLHFVTPAYCIFATVMGFYLGFLFQHFESLLIPIQLHFIYDLGALIYLRYYMRAKDIHKIY